MNTHLLRVRILGTIFILLSFISVGFLFSQAQAVSNIAPVEVVTPNQPLVAHDEATFFIIVNDEKLRENIDHFVFELGGGSTEPQTIAYNGENYVSFSLKVPIIKMQSERIMAKTFLFMKGEEKSEVSVLKNFEYTLKYPMGHLPSTLDSQVQSTLASKEYRFTKLRASSDTTEGKVTHTRNFETDFEKKLSTDDVAKKITEDKDQLHRTLTSVVYGQNTPTITTEDISPIDADIDDITITHAVVSRTMPNDKVYYSFESRIYVTTLVDNGPEMRWVFPFGFRQRATEVDPASYQSELEDFQSMVHDFAKSVTLAKIQNLEKTDSEATISIASGGFPRPLSEYDLENLSHSETYNQILEGNTPGVEELQKEKKEAEDRLFTLTFKNNNHTSIWNSGVVNTGTEKDTDFPIFVNITGKAFDNEHREIKDISSEELYKDVYVVFETLNPKSQIGILEGGEFQQKIKIKVEDSVESQYLQSKGPYQYKGPFFSSEYVAVYLVNKKDEVLSQKLLYTVEMKNAAPVIEMETATVEIDDKADGIFKFKINDEYHEKLQCNVKVPYEKYTANKVPVITVSRVGLGDTSVYVDNFECKTNEWISIRVRPPKLSNFDMLAQMNGLSMWDLQRGTMESFAMDLVGVGVDSRLGDLEKTNHTLVGIYSKGVPKGNDIGNRLVKYGNAIDALETANGLATDAQNVIKLTQIEKNAKEHIKDVQSAQAGSDKDWVETGYDWGISGINILQSTVGAVAMAPKHIPFVGKYAQKVTGKFTLAFNLMTNVWKGNLQYLSAEKKMDRAQDKNIPYPAVVEVSSPDGFRDVNVEIVNVLYTYLDNS